MLNLLNSWLSSIIAPWRAATAPLIVRVSKGETSRITLKVGRDVNYLTVCLWGFLGSQGCIDLPNDVVVHHSRVSRELNHCTAQVRKGM